MICISSEPHLKHAFREIDQDAVLIPRSLPFPIVIRDYIAWSEPSGHRVFLVFQDPRGGGARGIVFTRGQAANDVVQMCEWCHSVRGGNSVRLLTAQVGRNRRVGVHLCQDLNCKENVLGKPGVNDMREPYSGYEKLYRTLLKMSDFAHHALL